MSSLPQLMQRLKLAMNTDWVTIAKAASVPKQFVYDLRDGEARFANHEGGRLGARDDVRYQSVDALFRQNGIDGFLDAAAQAQNEASSSLDVNEILNKWYWSALGEVTETQDAALQPHRMRAISSLAYGFRSAAPVELSAGGPREVPGMVELVAVLARTHPPALGREVGIQIIERVIYAFAAGMPEFAASVEQKRRQSTSPA